MQKSQSHNCPAINGDLYLNDQADQVPYESDSYEVGCSMFKLIKEIGRGEFGIVYSGSVQVPGVTAEREVAVKIPRSKLFNFY